MVIYIDIHSHLHEYDEATLASLLKNSRGHLYIVAVSDDYSSSIRTVELAQKYGNILACVGLHPWSVGEVNEPLNEARKVVKLAIESNVRCLGEVGLDTKFVADTIDVQRKVFNIFLEAAKEYDLVLNLHTAGTWEEVFNLVTKYDIKYAIFHWYTGPTTLLMKITDAGYFISVNPAITIQKKHQLVVEVSNMKALLTESDGPYEYKGLRMGPNLIPRVVTEISKIKRVDEVEVAMEVYYNFLKIFRVL